MSFYFEQFEHRKPEPPLQYSRITELIWQCLAIIALAMGAWYLWWRWDSSLNMDALWWYAIPLVLAETAAYIGLILFVFNLWRVKDYPQRPAPETLEDVSDTLHGDDRTIGVDIFFPVTDEDPELVRLSLIDAKKINYPYPIDINIYVLDDRKRETIRVVAAEEGALYITWDGNTGFNAGNLRHAMKQSSGDFLVICDADTRLFPTILENTLGYFRDPGVAWVQTPQWFYDIPEGKRLPEVLEKYLSAPGKRVGNRIEKITGPIRIGYDPFGNDSTMFYDIIQRRRNRVNASLCCGAGSIHRRDAVMETALKCYAGNIEKQLTDKSKVLKKLTGDKVLDDSLVAMMRNNIAYEEEFAPDRFHVSESIYTSLMMHSDPDRHWKSVLHPTVEAKMLSPQDWASCSAQHFKQATGTLEVARNNNPLFRKGLSLGQRIMYAATIWPYLGGIRDILFLMAPLVYLFTSIAPVSAYSADFFIHALPFLIALKLAFIAGTLGLAGHRKKISHLPYFPINLNALWTVIKGDKIKFKATPKGRQEDNLFYLAWPQATVIGLTALGLLYAGVQYFLLDNPDYSSGGMLVNSLWGLSNMMALSGIVMAALSQPAVADREPEISDPAPFHRYIDQSE